MANQKILIVDDSKVIRMQVQEMLPKSNVEILEAKDGVEGMELVQQNHPNLILLDFFMPRMN
ncbi:MAG: response regulator, partial [Synechococcales cyanobacterium T60_A2020_003]|nr:response regulator [Synechococcales cyanobacterium T60_A2020_003]